MRKFHLPKTPLSINHTGGPVQNELAKVLPYGSLAQLMLGLKRAIN
ncbi:hypothetical protein GO755_20575 [Spirosoma sp. HMF4905]|uniref:Uncharacterized protein n=1 Tax=Spirosoma arboris TaxID=2682092 RepID=A0A7K1SF68_9BACT|nr:hypothetical protein [Spirosoma arboris]MVM32452.1 hypothetical protein [Spirosoma arboris]